jgi:DNA-binding transcriptional ArsR family regulator
MTPSASLDRTFAALSDPTRRAILLRLAESERTVNELAAPFRISLPAVSRHLKVLEKAALIVRIRDGQRRRCRLNPGALDAASDWLAFHQRFWSESVDRLAAELRRSEKPKEDKHGPVRKARRRRN